MVTMKNKALDPGRAREDYLSSFPDEFFETVKKWWDHYDKTYKELHQTFILHYNEIEQTLGGENCTA